MHKALVDAAGLSVAVCLAGCGPGEGHTLSTSSTEPLMVYAKFCLSLQPWRGKECLAALSKEEGSSQTAPSGGPPAADLALHIFLGVTNPTHVHMQSEAVDEGLTLPSKARPSLMVR